MKARTIAIVALPGVQLLDVSGPLDVFAEANAQDGNSPYALSVVAAEPGPIRSSSGARLMPDRVIGIDADLKPDTLLIAGCPNAVDVPADGKVVDWLRRKAPTARRFGSVCRGAFYLAAAGLLDGRRGTAPLAGGANIGPSHPSLRRQQGRLPVHGRAVLDPSGRDG